MIIRPHNKNRGVAARARISFVVGLLAALVVAAGAGAGQSAPSPLRAKLERALAVSGLGSASSAALAVDLTSGEVLFKRNRYIALEPASNEKLPVTYAALRVLGGSFRIATVVLGRGGQAGKVWRGDLVLKGFGDPTLSSRDLKKLAWLVRGAGIRRVTGSIVGDESYFDSKRGVWGWKSYFYGGECPPISALSVDRGVFNGRLAVRPAVAAAALFKKALRAAGVAVQGRSKQGRTAASALPLARIESPPLWKILRYMGVWSDNFTAELVLKQLGAREGRGTSVGGAAVVRRVLADDEIPMTGVRIVDGSGLSTRDRLTAAALVAILSEAWSEPALRKPLQSALAVAGKTGTLRDRLLSRSTKGHVLAKTGTTSAASALAGYVNGRYAFAVLHNGYPLASWYAKMAEDRFVKVLAGAAK